MRINVHRGAHEIGGTCVELSTKNTKILLDFGIPLTNPLGGEFDESCLKNKSIGKLRSEGILPDIKGLYSDETPQVAAILISHSHRDHYGFLTYGHPDIPIYISNGARKLVNALNKFIHAEKRINIKNYVLVSHKRSFTIGDFRITPYLVDHSGFDAMSYHITDKINGKSVFYSGDFRATGWKKNLFRRFIATPPKKVNYLIMEGTMIEREDGDYSDERSVLERLINIIRTSKNNVTLACVSGQNIDRIVTFYKAIRKTRSLLVMDPYTAYVLHVIQTSRKTIPQADWSGVRVLIENYFRKGDIYMNKIGCSDPSFSKMVGRSKIKVHELSKLNCKALVLMRNTMIPVINRICGIAGATLVYSQWEGYLRKKNKGTDKFFEFVDRNKLSVEHVHTGGHANIATLKEFAHTVVPKGKIIPVHTTSPHVFAKHFGDQTLILKNGKSIEI